MQVLCLLQNLRHAKSMLIHDCADMGDMCKKVYALTGYTASYNTFIFQVKLPRGVLRIISVLPGEAARHVLRVPWT